MKVRMRSQISGTRNGQEWPPPGSVVELPDDEAIGYCTRGMADPVTVHTETETAVAPEPEKRDEAPDASEKRGPNRPRKAT